MRMSSYAQLLAGLAVLLGLSATASANHLIVNTLEDTVAADGMCSLREALALSHVAGDCAAASYPGASDTITFSVSGTITINSLLLMGLSGALSGDNSITLDGSGQSITIDGNNATECIRAAGTVRLSYLTITRCKAASPQNGAAITGDGPTHIDHCTFLNNQGTAVAAASDQSASDPIYVSYSDFAGNTGGIATGHGEWAVSNSTFSNNNGSGAIHTAFFDAPGTVRNTSFLNNSADLGGAIYASKGQLEVAYSTFSGNTAQLGGAIYGGGRIANSTFSGNTATATDSSSLWSGGAIYRVENFPLQLYGDTFWGNAATSGYGGAVFFGAGGFMMIANTIIGNSQFGGGCAGNPRVVLVTGVNWTSDGSCLPGALTGDPQLGPLANNGGPTMTHALLPGSRAIDAGDNAVCAAAPLYNVDQRGQSRAQDGDGNGIAACDIGAFEFLSVPMEGNVAPSARVTVSSQNSGTGQFGIRATDGSKDGYPGNYMREWATDGELAGAFIQLTWSTTASLSSIVLYDRPNLTDHVLGGTLVFSDGSTASVGELPNGGTGLTVSFPAKSVTSVRFNIESAEGANIGLAELEAIGTLAETNIAPSASVAVSSQTSGTDQVGEKAIDGVKDGDPGDFTREWASSGEGSGAWIQLQWKGPAFISHVVLYDRPNLTDNIVSGTLTFSDGFSVPVGQLPNDGSGLTVSFTTRLVTWVRFTVTSAVGSGTGLSEFEVYGFGGTQQTNIAPSATATASSEYFSREQVALKAIDGVVGGFPYNDSEWASSGQLAGAWIQLDWTSIRTISKVVLYDRPNGVDNIISGTLTFSDGSSVAVGQLPNDGSGLTVNFTTRFAAWVRLTVTSAVGANIGLSEFQVF